MNNLNNMSMKELYVIAKERGIKNIKSFRKAELVELLTISNNIESKQTTPPEAIESISNNIQSETPNIADFVITAIKETASKVVEAIQKPFKFRFDHTRANKGDYFTKKVGENYIPLKVLDKDDKSTTVTTQSGIKLKLVKR